MARKKYKKKSSAKRAARGRPVYKVKGGWSIGKRRKRRGRKRRRGRRRKRKGNPYPRICGYPED